MRVTSDLIIDRYYRGAVLYYEGQVLAVPEDIVALLERLMRSAPLSDYDQETLDDNREALVEAGLLVES